MIGGKEETFDEQVLLEDMSVNLRFVGAAGKAAGQGIGQYGHEYQHRCFS